MLALQRSHLIRIGTGLIFAWLLVETAPVSSIHAQPSQIDNFSQLTFTLRAPSFEQDPVNGIRLLNDADRYSIDQPEGQPLLPHRQVRLGLPPDADLTSLELVVEAAQVEVAAGLYQFPLAGPMILACAPAAEQATAACGVQPAPVEKRMLNPFIDPLGASSLARTLTASFSPPVVEMLSPGQMRKWRFALLDFSPFRYEAQAQRLSVVRSATVTIRYRRDPSLVTPQILADRVSDELAPLLLDNYEQVQAQYSVAALPQKAAGTTDYLILTTNAIYTNSDLPAFVAFLEDHGFTVGVEYVANLAGYPGAETGDKIRAYLQSVYISWGLKYVLLVGDPTPANNDVPMRYMYPDHLSNYKPTAKDPLRIIATDIYYSNLTDNNWDLNGDGFPGETGADSSKYAFDKAKPGDNGTGGVDFTPSVYVGRIPVYNADYATLDSILQKIMDYESITRREAWQDKALLPMTFWGTGYDSAVLGHLLEQNLLQPKGISSYKIFMNHDDVNNNCDQISTYPHDADVAANVAGNYWASNQVGLMVWAGHGAPNRTGAGFDGCWLDDLFVNTEAAGLDNAHPAFAFLNSCINAAPEDSSNVAYTLLTQGAVAVTAATHNTGLMQTIETESTLASNYRGGANIAYHYVDYLMQGYPAGQALMGTHMSYAPDYYDDMTNFYDFNLYGDPSIVFYVPPISSPPAAPSNLTADPVDAAGRQLFRLRWQDNSNDEEYFHITMNATDHSGGASLEVSRNTIHTVSLASHAVCSKSYTIQVQAGNRDKVSGLSNTITIAADPCMPAAPTDLSAALYNKNIYLYWNDNSDNEAGFKIFRSLPGGGMEKIGQVGEDATTFMDGSAVCYSNYTYYVKAFNVTGEVKSENISIRSALCPPIVPVLSAPHPTQTTMPLSWTDGNDPSNREDGYEVWVRPAIGSWARVTTLAANTTAYTVASLFCSKSYDYKVIAFNNGGHTESTVVTASTSTCTPPTAPDSLTVNGNAFFKYEVRLNWNDNSDNEYGFKIEQQTGPTTWVEAAVVDVNQTATHITGLTCGTDYTFRIYAYNTYNSITSATATGSTGVCDERSPIHFAVTAASQTQINLTWDPAAGSTPVGYNLIRSGMTRTLNWEPLANVTAPTTTYSNTGLTCGTTYYYSLRSVFATPPTYSLYVSPKSAATLPCSPAAPTNLTTSIVSQNTIVVTWLPPAGASQTGYTLERVPILGGSWQVVTTLEADETSYEDSGLACNTGYRYRVQAFNSGGVGPYSAQVDSSSTYACTPNAPTGLNFTEIFQTSITLAWTDASDNETGFIIERSTDGGITWDRAGTTRANMETFFDDDLTCGTPYLFQVMANNTAADSLPSAVLATITLPCMPSLTATPGPQGLVTLQWSDPGQQTQFYSLQRAPHNGVPDWFEETDGDLTLFLDLSVGCGTSYDYYITATNASGTSEWPAPEIANTTCKPTTVINLTASGASIHSIHLSWSASSGGQTSYVIVRSPTGIDDWEEIATLGASANSHDDSNLPPGTRFYYRLRAVNAGGDTTSAAASADTWYVLMLPIVNK